MHWTRKVSQIQPLFTPAGGNPVLSEIDALLMRGSQAGGLSEKESLRLNILARVCGFGSEAAVLEDSLNKRLGRLTSQ